MGQHVCGVNMMIFYALTLFDTSGSGELTGSEQTLVVAAVQILVSLFVVFLVDLLGRRILLTLSSLLMGLFLILLGKYTNRRINDAWETIVDKTASCGWYQVSLNHYCMIKDFSLSYRDNFTIFTLCHFFFEDGQFEINFQTTETRTPETLQGLARLRNSPSLNC